MIGYRTHTVTVTDVQIIHAAKEWLKNVVHPDAPTDAELVRLKASLFCCEMISTNWLRNEVVRLRKNGFFKE